MEDIELKVKKIVAEQLGIKEEDIKNESSFIEDLGADSLTTVEMSLALEDAFDIEIPDTEQENLRTVQQAIDFVKAGSIDVAFDYFEPSELDDDTVGAVIVGRCPRLDWAPYGEAGQ